MTIVFEDKTTTTRSEKRTEKRSHNNKPEEIANGRYYRAFRSGHGAQIIASYKDHSERLKEAGVDANDRKLLDLANRMQIAELIRNKFTNSYGEDLNQFFAAVKRLHREETSQYSSENLIDSVFQSILREMPSDISSRKIHTIGSSKVLTVGEIISKGLIKDYINHPDFKDAVIEASTAYQQSPEKQNELERLHEIATPNMKERFAELKLGKKSAISFGTLALGREAINYAGKGWGQLNGANKVADVFTKNSKQFNWLLKSKAQDMIGGKAAWETLSNPQQVALLKKAASCTELLDDCAKTVMKTKAMTTALKSASAKVATNVESIGVKAIGKQLLNRADDIAINAARQSGGFLGKLKSFVPWLSKGCRTAGMATGPWGLVASIAAGFVIDIVIQEGIDAAMVAYNGGEIPEGNKDDYIKVGDWLGQGIHGMYKWAC